MELSKATDYLTAGIAMRHRDKLALPATIVALVAIVATPSDGSEGSGRIHPLPIGQTISGHSGDLTFGVYIPTRFGGILTITTTSGKVGRIVGPEGRERASGDDVGPDSHGWYTFTVTGAMAAYSVEAGFVQVAESVRKPWNFYYWPTKSDAIHEPWAGGNGRVDTPRVFGDDILVAAPGGPVAPGQDIVRAGPNGLLETIPSAGDTSTWFPNLYDDMSFLGQDGTVYRSPSPLLKYDQLFGTSARVWESSHSQNQAVSRWPGHCLGGAVASMLLNEPEPAPGSGMTRDELKALWAELGENHYNHRIGECCVEIPLGPPRPGPDETDAYASRVHGLLERHVRGRRTAVLANLRGFPPRGTPEEVWNHAIGRYTARYSAVPGGGERTVRLDVEIAANSGSSLDGQDDEPRVVRFSYILTYGQDGSIDESPSAPTDWLGLGGEAMYCPLNVLEVVESRWQGHNPYVSEANVRALDLANGGRDPRFVGPPPQFRPAATFGATYGAPSTTRPAQESPRNRRGLARLFGPR